MIVLPLGRLLDETRLVRMENCVAVSRNFVLSALPAICIYPTPRLVRCRVLAGSVCSLELNLFTVDDLVRAESIMKESPKRTPGC